MPKTPAIVLSVSFIASMICESWLDMPIGWHFSSAVNTGTPPAFKPVDCSFQLPKLVDL